MRALSFKTTDAGLDAIQTPPLGLTAAFAFLAVGRGIDSGANGLGYEPTGHETHLVREFMRVPLSGGVKVSPTQMSFAATLDGPTTGWINEIGLFLQDGTLWALWSQDPTQQYGVDDDDQPIMGAPLGFKANGIAYTISALIAVQRFSLDQLQIVVDGLPIALNVNLVEEHLSNLLALVVHRARGLRKLERARRVDEAHIADLKRRVAALEARS